jgi:uncharacterized protein YegP (UPF0339 family)
MHPEQSPADPGLTRHATSARRGCEYGHRNIHAPGHLVGPSQGAGQQRRIPREPIMAREPEFKILKNTDGEYYWHLEAAGSRVAAWSGQAYTLKQACVNDLYWIKDNASQIMIYDYTGE